MKAKISISIENGLLRVVEEKVREGKFRNVSQCFEEALKKLLREEEEIE